MINNRKKTVYVGISGGVDSSVSAGILKEKGYNVVGVFIDIWQPGFTECTSAEDRIDAMKVCNVLKIPFKTFDAKKLYENKVVNYMIEEYRFGRTPNPDIMCNKFIKFGIFFNWAIEQGADLVATGHYARIDNSKEDEPYLLKGLDSNKDQSYFLWSISKEALSKTIFPVGEMKKEEVRMKAKSLNLPTANKKDSQGICFLGKVDIKEFLSKYIYPKKGDVLDENSKVIGFHEGAWFYTIGQRHGFTVNKKDPNSKPLYIIKKNISKNTITVSPNTQNHTFNKVSLSNENWIPQKPLEISKEKNLTCLTRYRQKERTCNLLFSNNKKTLVIFNEPQSGLTEGQSVVIYNGNHCLGGGIIDKIIE